MEVVRQDSTLNKLPNRKKFYNLRRKKHLPTQSMRNNLQKNASAANLTSNGK